LFTLTVTAANMPRRGDSTPARLAPALRRHGLCWPRHDGYSGVAGAP
jgi:hypothetical protein